MLKPQNNGSLLTALGVGYIAFAEVLSLWTSKFGPPCLVISQYQTTDDKIGYQACATVHEGIARFVLFFWNHATHNNIGAAATVVIAIFTLTLWRSTDRLWSLGNRTAERELRAYLGFVGHNIQFERHEFVIVVKNHGQTPAREVRPFFNIQWYALGHTMPPDFAFADYPQHAGGSGPIFLNPGQEHPWSFVIDWDRFEWFVSGNLGEFYVYGRFEYLDVFGKRRQSQFNYQAVRFAEGGGAFRTGDRHNDCT
jgi:hypothetical protein